MRTNDMMNPRLSNTADIAAGAIYSTLLYNQGMNPACIEKALKVGIKIYLFEPKDIISAYRKYNPDTFTNNSLIYYYEIENKYMGFIRYDRIGIETINRKVFHVSFNYEQYRIEHNNTNLKGIIIKAGADTGKTKVMID